MPGFASNLSRLQSNAPSCAGSWPRRSRPCPSSKRLFPHTVWKIHRHRQPVEHPLHRKPVQPRKMARMTNLCQQMRKRLYGPLRGSGGISGGERGSMTTRENIEQLLLEMAAYQTELRHYQQDMEA